MVKIKSSHALWTALVLVFLALWIRGFWFTDVFRLHRDNAANRTAVLHIRDAIPLGASHSEALTAYWRHCTDDLRLFAEKPDRWIIRMPLEFGANDWTLSLVFHEGKVTAIRIRTSDGPAPRDGPEDKVQ